MSPWKSRWSRTEVGERGHVEAQIASTRPSASAWDDTSITTASAPCSRITASRACSSAASGVVTVVRRASSRRSSSWKPMVPISPTCRPAARSADCSRYGGRRLAVGAGDPEQLQTRGRGGRRSGRPARGSRARGPATTATGADTETASARSSPSASVSTATAPRSIASAAKLGTVHGGTGRGDVEVPRVHQPGVRGHAAHPEVRHGGPGDRAGRQPEDVAHVRPADPGQP